MSSPLSTREPSTVARKGVESLSEFAKDDLLRVFLFYMQHPMREILMRERPQVYNALYGDCVVVNYVDASRGAV